MRWWVPLWTPYWSLVLICLEDRVFHGSPDRRRLYWDMCQENQARVLTKQKLTIAYRSLTSTTVIFLVFPCRKWSLISNLGCVGKIEHSRFLWFFSSHPILSAIPTVWFGVFISRQNLGWSRNSIPRSSGIFSTYEKRTWAISYLAYTSVCETDTVLPILLCKTNLDTSSVPELAKVKVKRSFPTLFWKMHRAKQQKVTNGSSARNWMTIEWSHYRISSADSKVRTTYYINSTMWKYCWRGFVWMFKL